MAIKKKTSHNPLTILLFIIGITSEWALSTQAHDNLILNGLVVSGTALYFYSMDDIEQLIRNLFNGKTN